MARNHHWWKDLLQIRCGVGCQAQLRPGVYQHAQRDQPILRRPGFERLLVHQTEQVAPIQCFHVLDDQQQSVQQQSKRVGLCQG